MVQDGQVSEGLDIAAAVLSSLQSQNKVTTAANG